MKRLILERLQEVENSNSTLNNQELDAEKQYVEVIEQQLDLVKEAEEECLKAEKMHAARVRDLLQIEMALSKLLQEHGSSIKKARPYYKRKEVLTRTTNSQLELMSILEHEVQERKDSYSDSMRVLEQISEQIHQERASQSRLAQSSDAESDSSRYVLKNIEKKIEERAKIKFYYTESTEISNSS
ncbi:hypothetical protein GCK72_008921 [Caenorhabditis remanei]|uniref:Guanine nucleotide exchange factor rei n=1 Tax=Caenorhabditis remanei TaxID=31234 RepID=A0A6A5H2G8_CAERE|nr:hypothetical protein GCK72_008921 [Caenorhabditis remanei]KAF1760672.1 hypothetical protein GCK72_008921 [Caenorhabditis remanei]